MAARPDLLFPAALMVAILSTAPVRAAPTGHSTSFGDWVVECRVADSGQTCDMTQRVIDGRTQMQLVRFRITGRQPAQVKVLVPLGAWLDPGVGIRFDSKDEPFLFSYSKCLADGCLADGPLTPELLTALKSAQQGTILVADRNHKVVGVPFSAMGFGEALAALKKESEPKQDWWAKLQAQIASQVQKISAGKW